jgi:hypothetical protein
MGALTTVWNIIKAVPAILAAIKAIIEGWKRLKYEARKEKFQEGTVGRDQTKVEESFDSDKAGKPSGHGKLIEIDE